jgi:hypothetical protein
MLSLAPMLPITTRPADGPHLRGGASPCLELSQPLTDIYWLHIADPELPFTGVIDHTNFMPPRTTAASITSI